MKSSLQKTLKQSETSELVMGYYSHKRDTIYVCKAGKIIERLAGWQMPYFINKYVQEDAA